MKKTLAAFSLILLGLAVGACNVTTAPKMSQANFEKSMHGAAGQMPAFYDDELFTVNMMEAPENASENLEKNESVNEIYASNDLDEEQEFIPVLDAIQGDGFNPLWEQILIVFNPGFTPHQFMSDVEIDEAAEAGEITLVETEEVYRCSVVGPKK